MGKLSPMMEQYLEIKAAHKDHVLFFRLGDFYEMFFDDAVEISRELELTLTGRDCGLPERAPMCGIPYHASATYIKRLIEKGYKVAICEQTEEAGATKGIVKRSVVRIITPGTVIEEDLLEDAKNNYIASIRLEKTAFAVCFTDISTGETQVVFREGKGILEELSAELSTFLPREIICDDHAFAHKGLQQLVEQKLHCVCSRYEQESICLSDAADVVRSHFNIAKIDELSIPDQPLLIEALGGLIAYLNRIQADGAKRVSKVTYSEKGRFLNLDVTARQNLEITETMRGHEKRGSLLWVLDRTKTAMGKRYLRGALDRPLLQIGGITKRQNAIARLLQDSIGLQELQQALSGVYDLERLMTRVLYGTASPRDLRALEATANNLPTLKTLTAGYTEEYLSAIHRDLDLLEDVANLVDNAIAEQPPVLLKDGGYIKDGFHSTLDELRALCNDSKTIIANIEETEREQTGIKNLKIKYNRVFGYYLEVTNSFAHLVPEHYIRKQTLANAERYITQELKELESKILTANDKILALEAEIFQEVRGYIAGRCDVISQTAQAIARLDFICALSEVALHNQYTCPHMTVDGSIVIKDGRHPVVEQLMKGAPFVPNDIHLDGGDNRMMVITGPNMAGKSTYMRQVAVLVIMAQIGSFVPASSATISVVDQIFTRVGASDDLAAGQSTFMVEMSEMAHILKSATPQSLVILDEVGRGTSTFDGMSIAKAVVEHLATHKKLCCKTLFATHYHELTSLEEELQGVKNYNIAVKKRGDDITFLRKIVRGGADDSLGIEVAKLAGIPTPVVNRAKEILKQLEEEHTVTVIREAPEAAAQASFQQYVSQVEERLQATTVDTLTPIEALNLLYELKKMINR